MDYYPIHDGKYFVADRYMVVEEQPLPTEVLATTSLIHSLWGVSDGDKMVEIFECESGMKQWADEDTPYSKKGEVLKSPTNDLGIAQIHIGDKTDWLATATDMGYDLEKPEENLLMAKYVWDRQGFGAWTCAKLVGVL